MQLGSLSFPNNIIQGPLAGISKAPFRRLMWKYSQPAFSCTEMISCKTILYQPAALLQQLIKIDPEEGPVCFQLSGSDVNELAEATKRVTAFGASLIDLNCGCPVKKIRRRGAGSSLLTNAPALFKLIRAMKENTHVPVSVKIRVEGSSDEVFNADVANAVHDAGADFLIVHGRHWTEHYETPCQYDDIQFFVDHLPIPVIGNGDISSLESLVQMQKTGCAGMMVSRASVGKPWLIRQLLAGMNQEAFSPPDVAEIGAIFIEHVTELSELIGNETLAILQARKIAKYYAKPLSTRAEFCNALNACEKLDDFKLICSQNFRGVLSK